ncbi:hypothetical protein AZE42_08996 [Rhizopogon vesiculosus]|uniref:Uncharacterized protein n=1 Tax=Rhizopogon vesiculosus TaxID=180088 RepID=A0A1J8Q1H4_9AGAM|nr:hypothetical protein AZE42_08996 [Rhizopogon vesiculosus]
MSRGFGPMGAFPAFKSWRLQGAYRRSDDSSSFSHLSLLDEFRSINGVLATFMGIEDDPSLPAVLRGAISTLMAQDGPVAKLQADLRNLLPAADDLKSRKMSKMAKSVWPFKEKKAAAIVARLKRYYGDIAAIVALNSWNMLKDVRQTVQEVKEDFGVQKEAEEREKLLQWMKPVFCSEKHDTCSRQRNKETGRWIVETDQYRVWDTSDFGPLWLKGQPGSGKTILASTVIDDIRSDGRAAQQTLAYFYCDFRVEQATNGATVLRSLVVQLLRKFKGDLVAKFPELDRKKSSGEGCPTDLDFLRSLLVDAAKLIPGPAIVIDALDECKDHSDLLECLANLAEDARLRLFVTSRIEQDIADSFCHFPVISLVDKAEQMQKDIHAHITEQLRTQRRLLHLPEALRIVVLEKLLEKAGGMFRWVQCQLDAIMALKSPDSVRRALDHLPKGLDETYDRIIRAIEQRGPDDGPIAQRCLLWLAGAFTPLTLDQLEEAIMIETGWSSLNEGKGVMDPRDIVVACGSLVIYDEKTRVIALSHYSVKEYLIGQQANIHRYRFSNSDMHAEILQLSIAYLLCNPVFEDLKEVSPSNLVTSKNKKFAYVAGGRPGHPLLSYAVQGLTHLGYVSLENTRVMESLSRLHSELHLNTEKWSLIANAITDSNGRVRAQNSSLTNNHWLRVTSPSLLFIPLQHGKPWMVEFLVKQQPHLLGMDVAPGWGSPLMFTIALNPDFLTVLKSLGVDLNQPSSVKNDFYSQTNIRSGSYTPTSWAVAIGKGVAVDFLMSQSEVNLPDDILYTAVTSDEPSHEVVRKLRQRGADVNFAVDGSSPLHTLLSRRRARQTDFVPSFFALRGTSNQDWLPVVKELVEPSCDLSVQDQTARTVLHIALDKGLSNVVIYLLKKHAQLSATATLHPNMWSWAKNEGWFPHVQEAAAAAHKPCTRVRGRKVFVTPGEFQLVEFRDIDFSRIRAVVVSAIIEDETSESTHFSSDVIY